MIRLKDNRLRLCIMCAMIIVGILTFYATYQMFKEISLVVFSAIAIVSVLLMIVFATMGSELQAHSTRCTCAYAVTSLVEMDKLKGKLCTGEYVIVIDSETRMFVYLDDNFAKVSLSTIKPVKAVADE